MKEAIKVLFLDFDGVLNHEGEVRWHYRIRQSKKLLGKIKKWLINKVYLVCRYALPKRTLNGLTFMNWWFLLFTDHCDFCPIACSNLQELLTEDPELRIVISSTWRLSGLEYCKRVLRKNGVDASRVIGRTDVGYGFGGHGGNRGWQIQDWLNENNRKYKIVSFAIVDDDADMAHLMPRLVQTSAFDGLVWSKAREIKAILDVPYRHRKVPRP